MNCRQLQNKESNVCHHDWLVKWTPRDRCRIVCQLFDTVRKHSARIFVIYIRRCLLSNIIISEITFYKSCKQCNKIPYIIQTQGPIAKNSPRSLRMFTQIKLFSHQHKNNLAEDNSVSKCNNINCTVIYQN